MEKIKTCCYVRTSTTQEIQQGSFQIQEKYLENLIRSDPELEYVGCYGDFGKSGKDAEKRPEFQRMLRDCEEGKIQFIYTKSVSRFARSIADLVETVTKLRSLGIFIYFDEQKFSTEDRNMELFLHILGIIAEQESRSYSENVKLGLHVRMATGHPVGKVPYGYRRIDRDANWAIVEDEAKRIRLMFRMAGKGECYSDILKALNELEEAEDTGLEWKKAHLYRMLRSVAYKGDVITGKTTVVEKKRKRNEGEYQQYHLQDHHEAIVTRELFDRVQSFMDAGLLHSMRCRMTAEQKASLRDESWMAAQDRLESKGTMKVIEGGYGSGHENG